MAHCSRLRLLVAAGCLFLPGVFLAGCGKLFNTPGPQVTGDVPAVSESATKPPAPLEASVAQAFFVGGTLHIKVRLEALHTLPAEDVVVGVLGLREGHVVETSYERLREIINDDTFDSGKSALLSFELKAENLSEYQVRCSWGEEAIQLWALHGRDSVLKLETAAAPEAAPAQAARAQTARALAPTSAPEESRAQGPLLPSIEEVELEEKSTKCGAPPCDLEYTIRAKVVNRTASPIEAIRLAVGISWSESKNLPKGPEHGQPLMNGEELVELRELLQPGQGKKLKVKVARAVPVVPGGAFLPYIRLVESAVVSAKK